MSGVPYQVLYQSLSQYSPGVPVQHFPDAWRGSELRRSNTLVKEIILDSVRLAGTNSVKLMHDCSSLSRCWELS